MGLRFYRRLSLLSGIRMNFSRSGPSVSVGTRGAWFTSGPRGARTTFSLPGSGISYTSFRKDGKHLDFAAVVFWLLVVCLLIMLMK
jgi:hypothetical protein